MTEDQIKVYLKERGCADFVWQGGSKLLLERWEKFVAEVENGYCENCLIEEYWNDLDIRELIHEIGYDEKVAEVDKRLSNMLVATEIKHNYKDRDTDFDFWNYGYPHNASGYFYEEIKRNILGK